MSITRITTATLFCLACMGCAGHSGGAASPPSGGSAPLPARVGKVTKEMILADGGQCDRDDLCFDRKSRRDFDCDVEFYCVPTSISPATRADR